MNNTAQAANGVDCLFFTEVVGREDGPDDINELFCEELHFLIVRIGC